MVIAVPRRSRGGAVGIPSFAFFQIGSRVVVGQYVDVDVDVDDVLLIP